MTRHPLRGSAREEFAQAFKFHREQRNLTTARVADMAKVDRIDVEQWERGVTIPDAKAWELCKKMVHRRLHQLSPLRTRALAELNPPAPSDAKTTLEAHMTMAAQMPDTASTLMRQANWVRPFEGVLSLAAEAAALDIVDVEPEPEPEPEPVKPVVEPEPELAEDGPSAVNPRPTSTELAARITFAVPLVAQGWRNDEIQHRTRLKFGSALRTTEIAQIRRDLVGGASGRSAIKAVRSRACALEELASSTPVTSTPAPEFTVPPPPSNASDIMTAAQLVLGAIPNLRTFTITVDDNGEATISHTQREVRVIETSGTLKLPAKKAGS